MRVLNRMIINIPVPIHSSLVARVADFVINSVWTIPRLIVEAHPNVVEDIVQISTSRVQDKLIWQGTCDGILSLKDAFRCIRPEMEDTRLWDWLSRIFNFHIDTTSIETIFLGCNGQWSPQVQGVLEAAIIHIINTVWFCRNRRRFENKNLTLLQHNFQKAPRIKEVVWLAPQLGWIQINTDGVAHGSPGFAGGGCIYRDSKGDYMGGFTAFFGVRDSLFAKLQATIMAVEIAQQKGWRDIWFECDSVMVVDIFNGKWSIPWRLANKWSRCMEWISSIRFKVSHIFRESNTCADRLTAFGVSFKVFTWWDVTPRIIFEKFNKNRLELPNYRYNFL
ncbi:hypothetical protein Lal_00028523 [Lupinus albus]|nr:hypothetical protein Lal_00028523 [Lupinus albus]